MYSAATEYTPKMAAETIVGRFTSLLPHVYKGDTHQRRLTLV